MLLVGRTEGANVNVLEDEESFSHSGILFLPCSLRKIIHAAAAIPPLIKESIRSLLFILSGILENICYQMKLSPPPLPPLIKN